MSEEYETKTILNKSVMDTAAMQIGKVKDIVINISDWSVQCLLVKIPRPIAKELGVGGFTGATARLTPQHIEKIGDFISINITAQELVQQIEVE
jgi:sporulation protein YlmC with PRC-barrel domain